MRRLVHGESLADRVEVDSAGTAAYHAGEPADARSAATALTRGVELTSIARRFEVSDFERFDYVVAMDRENRDALTGLAPDDAAAERVALLRSYAGEPEQDVPDPYYGGPRGFDEVFDICERGCAALLEHIRKTHAL